MREGHPWRISGSFRRALRSFKMDIGILRKALRTLCAFTVNYASEASINTSLVVRRESDGQTGYYIYYICYYIQVFQ
ncbi:hypothetical protein Y032_0140g2152 [Ancylostoma ceylanicum]|uniref:Uncharacterized protein n=1 Tax=Ancylostoma ceylanicum TaxID=53326 RepID=A0A016T499_9BILA|nr:hypothetical protein Y032_0140g2152 [Ancylostoma ceylanicum]